MKPSNRDLLVLVKDESETALSMELTLQQLNQILFNVETMDTLCTVNEIIDMNKYKVVEDSRKVMSVLRQKEPKPFQFIYNKN